MKTVPAEAGKSSFDLIDKYAFLNAIPKSGLKFILDVGCGIGNYTFAMAEHYPSDVSIIGIDPWEAGINALNTKAHKLGLHNVKASLGSALKLTEIMDSQVDMLLMATVAHDLVHRGEEPAAFAEAARVLRPGGTLAVVEFKKVETKPGPPLSIRLSAVELSDMVKPQGFVDEQSFDLGPSCYLLIFRRV